LQIQAGIMNALLLAHFDHPRHAGDFPGQAGDIRRGEAGSEHHGALVRFALKMGDDGRISDLRFKAWGCAATIACASLVAEWAIGRTLEDARSLDVRALVAPFQLAPERLYAPLLVEDALRAASADEE